MEKIKDVHTEHCCSAHGCKYGDDDCTVTTGKAHQSYPCEECDNEDGVMPLFKTEQREEIDRLKARVADQESEIELYHATLDAQSKILNATAIALKGPEGELSSHSHHDLAECAHQLKARLAELSDCLHLTTDLVAELMDKPQYDCHIRATMATNKAFSVMKRTPAQSRDALTARVKVEALRTQARHLRYHEEVRAAGLTNDEADRIEKEANDE